ncbi:hypothetical protein QEG73_14935 [Chitinophagaceae bacterium 26-R-25]|nr:hypothetical protein [Chitinophagaceae bacterium 26-R-25]
MTISVIIVVIVIAAYFLFFRRKKEYIVATVVEPTKSSTGDSTTEIIKADANADEEIFTDANGCRYRLINKTREVPRKTYLLGSLNGKYWGEINIQKEEEYLHSQFYDFHIYEIEVSTITSRECACCTSLKRECNGLHTDEEGGFPSLPTVHFPREKLPRLLPIVVKRDQMEYEVNIYEPQLANIHFVSKLHQTDGKEVFGTIEARITGYLLDFIAEQYTEVVYLHDAKQPAALAERASVKTLVPTGNVEFKGGYQRTEYFYSDHKTPYWSDWHYKNATTTPVAEGCLSSTFGILVAIIGLAFLLMLLPRMAIIIPFILLPILFLIIPEVVLNWILRFAGIFLMIVFVGLIIHGIGRSSRTYIPKPIIQESRAERRTQFSPINEIVNQTPVKDTVITHYRSWRDYDNNDYQGKFWVKSSALSNASSFKNSLSIAANNENGYNEMVYRLKENDKNNLNGVYQLFDSIRVAKSLSTDKFAELIVSFVQDIPYTVVLPYACNSALYSDNFIKNYLASNDARCDGFERFGINTPVEFIATLNGDCDTRTLLIYTILSHYGYDVAMLSSEYYNHSLIGINLPYSGISYVYKSQRYVLWETTAPNVKPGILPNEISNLNYWRISLKSK